MNKYLRQEENDDEHVRQRDSLAMRYNSRGLRRVSARINQQREVQDDDPSSPPQLQFLRLEHLSKSKHTLLQSIAYVMAFLMSVSFTIYQVYTVKFNPHIIMKRMQMFLQPSQGFFNFLIFVGFKVYNQKNQNPTNRYSTILYSIFFKLTADPVFVSRGKDIEDLDHVLGRDNDISIAENGIELESIRNLNMDTNLDRRYVRNDHPRSSTGSADFPILSLAENDDDTMNLNNFLGEELATPADIDSNQSGRLSYFTQEDEKDSLYDYEDDCSSGTTLKR